MKLHELRQKRTTIATQMRALHEDIADNAWNDEQRTKWDGMTGELDKLDEQIKRSETIQANDQLYVEDTHEERSSANLDNDEVNLDKRYQEAFDTFVRNGGSELTGEQRKLMNETRAQSVGTDAKGGYTVPVEFRNEVIEKMKSYGGLASVCQILNTINGQTIEWATTDGTSEEGELLGENAEASEEDVTFGTENLGAKKLSSKIIRISNELLNDSGVSIEALLTGRIASRLGRGESKYAVQGTGAGLQPKGLNTSVTLSQAAAASAAITYSDLMNLKHKVDPSYRNGPSVRFGFNDNTFKAIKLLKDSQNRPLWLPSIAGVAPSTIDGDEFFIDQAIEDIGTGNSSAFYGDFNRFILRRVQYMTLKRLVERYAEFDQTGFLAFHRFDTVLEDTSAIGKLQHA
ncbi:phage major capsid protein [Glaciecola sp. 2405UD65-10]|uniref:phage major capsid protein n=1 Tax=Glaciecola sp. 2405UD65-10 TaxID=3397244 RepID=UPI003B5CF053